MKAAPRRPSQQTKLPAEKSCDGRDMAPTQAQRGGVANGASVMELSTCGLGGLRFVKCFFFVSFCCFLFIVVGVAMRGSVSLYVRADHHRRGACEEKSPRRRHTNGTNTCFAKLGSCMSDCVPEKGRRKTCEFGAGLP